MKPSNPKLRRETETAREAFANLWRTWKLREKRKVSTWAEQERIMPIGSPLSDGGTVRYDHAAMPHCSEPMDCADDPSVRVIVLWFGIREGFDFTSPAESATT